MNLFYAPGAASHQHYSLPDRELHHLHVLRMSVGDEVKVFDGLGNLFSARIDAVDKKQALLFINELEQVADDHKPKLHIAIAPPKNMERFEWFAEKVCEIGVDSITPVICKHSERKELRADRIEKVLLAACKQSLKYKLPVLNSLTTFSDFIDNTNHSLKFIAWCGTGETHFKNVCLPGKDVLILIGPEGDFDNAEVNLAVQNGYTPVSLGSSRLRLETAGIFVSCIFNLNNQ